MRMITSDSKKLNGDLGRGMRTFNPWNWVPLLIAAALLLTAISWVAMPQAGQAQGTPPAQPTGLTATPGGTQAALTWNDPSDSSITGYEYLRAQVAKLPASDEASGDRFGRSVAMDGDTAVVGAIGAAYVYTRQSGAWSQVATLTDSDGGPFNQFGYSVAVDGDTVVVGAHGDDAHRGAAYVFTKPADGWVTANETAKLTAFDKASGDNFGFTVAVEGDTVVVGAIGDDSDKGAAYVFTKPDNEWASTSTAAKLTAFDGANDDQVGRSVAVDGDTVVVGAHGDDAHRGAAYVFTKPADGWVTANETAKLTAFDKASGDNFGFTVAVDGDTVVVGAIGDDSDKGAAYVFTKPANGWATTNTAVKLTASDGAYDDGFGYSVAVDGDTVVVGAHQDDHEGSESGSAYLFTKPANGWATGTETIKLTPSDGAYEDFFGGSVAVDGDTVVVGAASDDDQGSNSGSIYVYKVSDWTDISDSGSGGFNATSYTATGLTNDVEYDFWIRAVNASGAGTASAIVAVTPTNTAPTAVEDTGTTLENSSVDINVVANDTDPDPGATLSVTAVTTPSNGTAVIASGSTTTVTYTPDADFAGTDSFDYTLTDGTDTDTGTVTVAVGLPPPPTGLTATPGDGQLTLDWNDPGDSDIIEYQYSTDGGITFTDISGSDATTTRYTVTGLSTGTEYTIALRAANASGNGQAATVTARTWWPAPTNLVAAPDSGRVVLQWDTGDPEITHYLVRTELAANSWDIGEKFVAASAGPRTTTDITSLLTNGTEYFFIVQPAVLRDGFSNYMGIGSIVITGSPSSVTETPTVAVPAAPTNLTATPGDGQVAVTWDNPGNITIRKYQYSTDGGANFNHMNGSNQDTTSFTFTGLDNGETYTLKIRASNLSGESAAATVIATPSP